MKRFLDKVGTLMENRFENLNTIKEEDTQFWTQIFLGFIQLKGLQNGYKYHITKHNLSQNALSLGEFLIIQADGEVPELLSKIYSDQDISTIRTSLLLQE